MTGPVNVTIITPFRDEMKRIWQYMDRIARIEWPPACLRVVAVEGDSVDATWSALQEWRDEEGPDVTLVKCDTGRRRYGSVVNAERFQILATVFNAGLDAVDYEWSDWILMLPCDIVYGPDLVERLVTRAIEFRCDLLAPFVFQAHRFYDTWAFTQNGQTIGAFHQEQAKEWGDVPFRMDTVGGTLLMRATVPGVGVRYTPELVDRGFCISAHSRGFGVFADPATHVFHPPYDRPQE